VRKQFCEGVGQGHEPKLGQRDAPDNAKINPIRRHDANGPPAGCGRQPEAMIGL
jgi:hypothetical protein